MKKARHPDELFSNNKQSLLTNRVDPGEFLTLYNS